MTGDGSRALGDAGNYALAASSSPVTRVSRAREPEIPEIPEIANCYGEGNLIPRITCLIFTPGERIGNSGISGISGSRRCAARRCRARFARRSWAIIGGVNAPFPLNNITQTTRLRGARLQKIRAAHFRLHPLCVRCKAKGVVTLATQLDHVIALVNGGLDFDEDDGTNRQGLCEDCHLQKTAEDMGQTYRPRVDILADGWPLRRGV